MWIYFYAMMPIDAMGATICHYSVEVTLWMLMVDLCSMQDDMMARC